MKYKLRYRIRDWIFRKLFPTIARHESHLVDDCLEMAIKIRELENAHIEPVYLIDTGTNDVTQYEHLA